MSYYVTNRRHLCVKLSIDYGMKNVLFRKAIQVYCVIRRQARLSKRLYLVLVILQTAHQLIEPALVHGQAVLLIQFGHESLSNARLRRIEDAPSPFTCGNPRSHLLPLYTVMEHQCQARQQLRADRDHALQYGQ